MTVIQSNVVGEASHKVALDCLGWTVIHQALDRDMVATIRSWIESVEALGQAIPDSYEPEFEPEAVEDASIPRKLRRLFWNDRSFWEKVIDESGIDRLARALVPDPVLIFHAAFLKPRCIGSPVGFHQDQALWPRSFPGAVSAWFALDDADEMNGAVSGFSGSHLRGLIRHQPDLLHPWHPTIDPSQAELAEPVTLSVTSGDAIVWHRYFVHGSAANRSDRDRRGMVMVFASKTFATELCNDQHSL